MTTDTIVVHISNYEQWGNQIVVFRALLEDMVAVEEWLLSENVDDKYIWRCSHCYEIQDMKHSPFTPHHSYGCTVTRIERALAADVTEIARLAALEDTS